MIALQFSLMSVCLPRPLGRAWASQGDIDVKPNATVENGTGDAANGSGHRRDHSGRWRHCAEELQLCMCAGEVRFGNGQHWASEVLHTRQVERPCASLAEAHGRVREVSDLGGLFDDSLARQE